MPNDELFKRYLEIGASVLGMSRERAESIVRDLVASGEVAKAQATKAADWLVERGRAGTEELNELVRREIGQQVTALGLATREDVARLQAQIEELRAATPAPGPTSPTVPTEKATAKKAAAEKATAKKAARQPTARKATAGKATAAKAAGISRSASVGTGTGDMPPAGDIPPGGDTVPPKG